MKTKNEYTMLEVENIQGPLMDLDHILGEEKFNLDSILDKTMLDSEKIKEVRKILLKVSKYELNLINIKGKLPNSDEMKILTEQLNIQIVETVLRSCLRQSKEIIKKCNEYLSAESSVENVLN